MKSVNVLLLVLAGALGGAVIMRVIHPRPAAPVKQAATPATAPVVETAAAAQVTPVAAPQPETAAPAPATATPAPPEPAPAPPVKAQAKPAKPTPVKHPTPLIVYSDARPSPFHKEPLPKVAPPPVQVAEAAPPPAEQTPAVPPAAAAPSTPPVHPEPEPEPQTPAPPPPAAPQPVRHTATLNAGMLISVRLVDGLSSERALPGDAFQATLDHELVADGFVIAERGARVEGRVVSVDRGNRVHGGAALAIELTRLHTSDNQDVAIETETFDKRTEPNHTTDAEKVGGGAAIGAIIGAIAGGGKGAALGAGAGAGAGAGDVLLTRKPSTLPSETRISFRLKNAVTLTERLSN